MRKDKNFKLSISLLMVLVLHILLILLLLPSAALASGVNYGEGEYGGSTGTGTSRWKYYTDGRGVRISIYFVEGRKEKFADPNFEINQIGKPTETESSRNL